MFFTAVALFEAIVGGRRRSCEWFRTTRGYLDEQFRMRSKRGEEAVHTLSRGRMSFIRYARRWHQQAPQLTRFPSVFPPVLPSSSPGRFISLSLYIYVCVC